jgi:hypothetical protein
MHLLSQQFCAVNDVESVAALVETTPISLMRLRFEKPYLTFEVRKLKGKQRLIEAPKGELKTALKKLNNYLQCTYFFHRTPAAYGFIQQPRNTVKKKNILTNARLHCGKKYLLNVDLKDFFHQVSHVRVAGIFKSPPFQFNMELSSFLAELTTYNNRLPMGSPTSPVLTNFATIEMDNELLRFAQQKRLRYSRYVDDLSFSSDEPIDASHFHAIYNIISQKGFTINHDKVQFMGEGDEKVVTGLILKDRPVVPPEFLQDLEGNLKKLKHVLEFSCISRWSSPTEWIEEFDEHLLGKLRFLQMVYGPYHPVVKNMYHLYHDAHNTRAFVESFSWNNFPYI